MSNNYIKNIISFIKKYNIIIVISFLNIALIIAPFFISNNLEGFDYPGHYANAYYIKNNFWPFMGGLNSFFLSDFPQGLFYPSLFHWLVATMGFIFPLIISYKIILLISIFLFPLASFIFSNSIFRDIKKSEGILIITSIIYFFDVGLNDNLFSDIYFGMSSHLFSLTIFIIYLYSINKLIQKKINWYLPSLILSILIITHTITASISILFSLILLIYNWSNIFLRLKVLKHLFIAFLMSLWWIVPFLININYISGNNISLNPGIITKILIFILLIINIYGFLKNKTNIFLKTLSIFNILLLIIYSGSYLFTINNFPIHFSRILIYPFLLSPILLVSLFNYEKSKLNINLILLLIFFIYGSYFKVIPIGPFNTDILKNIENYYDQNSRVIVTGNSKNLDDRFHSTRTKLSLENNMKIAGGLFTESSSNGWFMMSLLKSWENNQKNTFLWGYNNLVDVDNLEWGSKIFGINYEYRIQDIKPTREEIELKSEKTTNNDIDFKINRIKLIDNEKIISILSGVNSPFYYQAFYKVNNTSIAEVLNNKPINITEDWNQYIIKWWSTDWLKISNHHTYDKPILIYKTETDNWNIPIKNMNLDIKENATMKNFSIEIPKGNPVPVYIKKEYFPFWKAYNENNENINIYKASPNFMLIYSSGKITFKYTEPIYYNILYIISGISLIWIIFNLIKKKNNQ